MPPEEFLKSLHKLDEIWIRYKDAEYNERQLTQFAKRYATLQSAEKDKEIEFSKLLQKQNEKLLKEIAKLKSDPKIFSEEEWSEIEKKWTLQVIKQKSGRGIWKWLKENYSLPPQNESEKKYGSGYCPRCSCASQNCTCNKQLNSSQQNPLIPKQ